MNSVSSSLLLLLIVFAIVASSVQAGASRRLPYNCDYKSGKKGASCDTPSCCTCSCHPSGTTGKKGGLYSKAEVCECDCSACDGDDDDDDDDDGPYVCPADVKACPDGSFVSRDPKNDCKFKRCPYEPTPSCEVCKNGRHMANPHGEIEIPGNEILKCMDLYTLEPNQCSQLPDEIMGVCGCYEPCDDICGNGHPISEPDEYVYFPGYHRHETCGDIEAFALMGGVSPSECERMPEYVFDTCGCGEDPPEPCEPYGKKGGKGKGGGKKGSGSDDECYSGKKGGSYSGKKGGYGGGEYGGKKGYSGYGGKGGSYGKKGGYGYGYAPVESPVESPTFYYGGKKGGSYGGKKGYSPVTAPVEDPEVCDDDVHVCPDGTHLSRDPDNYCRFPDCPPPKQHYCKVPNYDCYEYGFPECCYEGDSNEFTYCPPTPPPCDVHPDDDDDDDGHYTPKYGDDDDDDDDDGKNGEYHFKGKKGY